MRNYQVIVGNIGTVYDGGSEYIACQTFDEYARFSQEKNGRAAGESVVLMMGDRILREVEGTQNEN
jgi:hypothetical protein